MIEQNIREIERLEREKPHGHKKERSRLRGKNKDLKKYMVRLTDSILCGINQKDDDDGQRFELDFNSGKEGHGTASIQLDQYTPLSCDTCVKRPCHQKLILKIVDVKTSAMNEFKPINFEISSVQVKYEGQVFWSTFDWNRIVSYTQFQEGYIK